MRGCRLSRNEGLPRYLWPLYCGTGLRPVCPPLSLARWVPGFSPFPFPWLLLPPDLDLEWILIVPFPILPPLSPAVNGDCAQRKPATTAEFSCGRTYVPTGTSSRGDELFSPVSFGPVRLLLMILRNWVIAIVWPSHSPEIMRRSINPSFSS